MSRLRVNSTMRKIRHLVEDKMVLDIGNKGMAQGKSMGSEIQKVASFYQGIDEEEDVQKFSLGKKFEVITCLEVMEHIQNPGLAIDRIVDHLSDDGILILSVPNIKSIYFRFVPQTKYHLSCWDKKTLKNRLEKHFQDVRIKRINFGRTLLVTCRGFCCFI